MLGLRAQLDNQGEPLTYKGTVYTALIAASEDAAPMLEAGFIPQVTTRATLALEDLGDADPAAHESVTIGELSYEIVSLMRTDISVILNLKFRE